jgi:hypothetical protein
MACQAVFTLLGVFLSAEGPQDEDVTDQRSQKVRSQGQASTSIHQTIPDSSKTRSGLPAQPTIKSVCSA